VVHQTAADRDAVSARAGDLLRARHSMDFRQYRKADPQEQVPAIGHLRLRARRTVYSRVDGLGSANGMVGYAWNALHEAWCGEQSNRLLLLTYETLTGNPQQAIEAVYDFIGEKPFPHDFDNIEFDAAEFDRRLGTPGLHTVGRRVKREERQNLLPPLLIHKYENDAFWRDPARNPNNVKVV
jgi:sulfotransferase